MLTYRTILDAVTLKLSSEFSCDVIVDDEEGIFDKECLYISIIPTSIMADTRITDLKKLIISIKYFGGNKTKCYDIANSLNDLFNRSIKVDNVFLNVSNAEPNIFKDEVGSVLDFLMHVTYSDFIKLEVEEFDKIGDLVVNQG